MTFDFFFSCLNLLVLILACSYIFKRFVYSYIKKTIEEEQQAERVLEQEQKVLAVEQKQVKSAMSEDEQSYLLLQNKLDVWQEAVKNKFLEQQFQEQKQEHSIQQKNKLRAEFIAVSKIYQRVLMLALGEVKIKLADYAKNKDAQKKYVNQLLESIK